MSLESEVRDATWCLREQGRLQHLLAACIELVLVRGDIRDRHLQELGTTIREIGFLQRKLLSVFHGKLPDQLGNYLGARILGYPGEPHRPLIGSAPAPVVKSNKML